ncbi:MAG: hypothetical protein AMXMBFR4_31400 [Candidatus Hydrogenedentota bacterium]
MKVYLVQHGEAVDKEINPDRPLSAKGREEVETVAAFLQKAGVQVPVIWHSGKTRALETAEILAARIAPGGLIIAHAGLDPKDDPRSVLGKIEHADTDFAIVGHLPLLSRLTSLLLTGKDKHEPVAFERGGVVAIEKGETGQWQLRWAITPSLLR